LLPTIHFPPTIARHIHLSDFKSEETWSPRLLLERITTLNHNSYTFNATKLLF
jgi:hypothetical protein